MGDALRAPFRAPLDSLRMLTGTAVARALPLADKFRVLALKRLALSLSVEECFDDRYDATTARDFLAERGFTPHAIARFFAPFYGGILLGVLPGQPGVSWQGHLFGAVGGVVAAYSLAGRRRQRSSY